MGPEIGAERLRVNRHVPLQGGRRRGRIGGAEPGCGPSLKADPPEASGLVYPRNMIVPHIRYKSLGERWVHLEGDLVKHHGGTIIQRVSRVTSRPIWWAY